jgi:hypothetical protein
MCEYVCEYVCMCVRIKDTYILVLVFGHRLMSHARTACVCSSKRLLILSRFTNSKVQATTRTTGSHLQSGKDSSLPPSSKSS